MKDTKKQRLNHLVQPNGTTVCGKPKPKKAREPMDAPDPERATCTKCAHELYVYAKRLESQLARARALTKRLSADLA